MDISLRLVWYVRDMLHVLSGGWLAGNIIFIVSFQTIFSPDHRPGLSYIIVMPGASSLLTWCKRSEKGREIEKELWLYGD